MDLISMKGQQFQVVASKLPLLRTTAAQASQFATLDQECCPSFTICYREWTFLLQGLLGAVERNKQYIEDPSNAEKYQLLAKQLFYTCLASCYEAIWKESVELKNLLNNRRESRESCHCCPIWTRVLCLVLLQKDYWKRVYYYRLPCLKLQLLH